MPIIGLTGFEAAVRDLLAAGADEALQKPCPEEVLLGHVARLLARRA
jgi:CheY-like chemotaxis protein